MSEIVSLRGAAIPGNQEPQENVVEMLERYLAKAKDGQVRGIVFGIVEANGDYITGWKGDAEATVMLAAASLLAFRIAKWLDSD